MQDIIETLFTDPLFIKIGIVVAILIALSIFKKLFKVLLTLVVLFFLYIGYLVLSGEDPEYDPLSYIIYQYPENGEISLDVNLVTYEPHENFNGTDSFGFKANDGEYNSDLAMVGLTINPINDFILFM